MKHSSFDSSTRRLTILVAVFALVLAAAPAFAAPSVDSVERGAAIEMPAFATQVGDAVVDVWNAVLVRLGIGGGTTGTGTGGTGTGGSGTTGLGGHGIDIDPNGIFSPD